MSGARPHAGLLRWWRSGPPQPVALAPDEAARRSRRMREVTFASVTIGYAFFYTTRLSLAVAKKPMMDAGLVDAADLGAIGSMLYLTYAAGKLVNGFLCDRAHIGRFMATGLAVSALLNLAFGFTTAAGVFAALWALNGWFQAMGSAPSGANIAAWFPRAARGTRYSVWSMAQNLGEGITYVGTAALVAALGWRWAFFGPGMACLVVAVGIAFFVYDRPRAYGLPPSEADEATPPEAAAGAVARQQLAMLRNPAIWLVGLASAAMYVARYGINEWSMLYLQADKGYTLLDAGVATGTFSLVGIPGALLSGPISDRFFGGRRLPVSMGLGVLLIAALVALPLIPAGAPAADAAALGAAGFAIGGLLVFLGGLIAIDLCPPRATGAALGVVGVFSYLGAAVQNWISGALIEAGRVGVGEAATYDFGPVFTFWIGAAVASLLLTAALRGRVA